MRNANTVEANHGMHGNTVRYINSQVVSSQQSWFTCSSKANNGAGNWHDAVVKELATTLLNCLLNKLAVQNTSISHSSAMHKPTITKPETPQQHTTQCTVHKTTHRQQKTIHYEKTELCEKNFRHRHTQLLYRNLPRFPGFINGKQK